MSEISTRLLEFRNRFEKSQKEMAELLGIPFRTLQDCERGKTLPSAATLIAYSRLGADLNWIISDQDCQATPPPQNEWAKHFEPIPWFAPDDVRDSYEVNDEERRTTARISLRNDYIAELIPRWKPSVNCPFSIASTSTGGSASLVLFDTRQTKLSKKPEDVVVLQGKLKICRLQEVGENMIVRIQKGEASVFDSSAEIIGRVLGLCSSQLSMSDRYS